MWTASDRLEANFEPFPNTSLPRNSLFEAYERHSSEREHGEYNEPINTASFGKIIRSTFPTIQTRRLGVRGQSRYYYHGIRVIPTSELANVPNLQTVVRSDDSYRYGVALHCAAPHRWLRALHGRSLTCGLHHICDAAGVGRRIQESDHDRELDRVGC